MKEQLLKYLIKTYKDEQGEGILGQYTKMMAMYQLITSLSLINELDNQNINKQQLLDFIKQCQYDDGFSAYIGADSHILYTYNALQSLLSLHKIDELFNKEKAIILCNHIKNLYVKNKGFVGDNIWETVDTRYMLSGIGSLFILSRHFQDIDLFIQQDMIEEIYDLVIKLFNYDGLASPEFNYESHAMNVYMNLCTLKLIGKLEQFQQEQKSLLFNIKSALILRQTQTGGFNGRPEKLPDACYSQWCGMSCIILNLKFDHQRLNKFLLACQDKSGGFADRPGDQSDIFHTCYSVSWLSTQCEFKLQEVDPVLNIAKKDSEYLWEQNNANEQQLTSELDRITSIAMSNDSKLISVGDLGGRQIIFKNMSQDGKLQYTPLIENNSYISEYDPLRSYRISSEIINQIFLPTSSRGELILSCNEKDVKLHLLKDGKNPSLQLQKTYTEIAKYHLNSLCLSPLKDTFLVADDFDIYQYWIEDNIHCHKLTNQHNQSAENLIFRTNTIYHPKDQNLIFSSFTDGSLALYDMRQSIELNKIQQKVCNEAIQSINILAPNLIFTRTATSLQVTDVRNMQKQLFSLTISNTPVNPRPAQQSYQNADLDLYDPTNASSPHQPHFSVSFSQDKKFFATGGCNQSIFVGNLQQDVINWKVTRILKKSKKNQNFGNVNAKYVVKGGTQTNEKINTQSPDVLVENQIFGENCLVTTAGGNLYVYSYQ